MSGRVVHFEIPADDGERAAKFYTDAFGWTMSGVPGMDYTMVGTTPSGEDGMPSEAGSINGGMFVRSEEFPPKTPIITVDVEDIDASLTKIGELGGTTVSPKTPVGEMGFAAYFKDTEGNVLGLWENAPQGGQGQQPG